MESFSKWHSRSLNSCPVVHNFELEVVVVKSEHVTWYFHFCVPMDYGEISLSGILSHYGEVRGWLQGRTVSIVTRNMWARVSSLRRVSILCLSTFPPCAVYFIRFLFPLEVRRMHISSLISYLYLTNHAPQSPIAEIKSETGAPSASATIQLISLFTPWKPSDSSSSEPSYTLSYYPAMSAEPRRGTA